VLDGVNVAIETDDSLRGVDPGRLRAEDRSGGVERREMPPMSTKPCWPDESLKYPTRAPASLMPVPKVLVEPGTLKLVKFVPS
jgi:hypothetical protein